MLGKYHNVWALMAAFLAFAAGVWLNRADMYAWQIGVSHDSVYYLDAAKNILKGLGVANTVTGQTVPMTHYPPFYPLVLAAISFVSGAEPLRAAYFLAMFLMGANAVLTGFVVYKYANHNTLAGITAAALFLLSHAIVVTHYMAWSEPLFLFLMLWGIILLDKYLTTGNLHALFWTGSFFALAVFTRYAGLILVPFAGLAILLFRRQPLLQHARHILLVTLPPLIIVGGWMLRNKLLSGTGTNRNIGFLGFGDARVHELKTTIRNWFFSDGSVNAGFNRTMLVLLVAIVLLIVMYRKDLKHYFWQNRSKLAELMLMFGLLYAGFLIVSVTFVDASTPLDDRMLVPLFVALLCIFPGALFRAATHLPGKPVVKKVFQFTLILILIWFGLNRYNYTQYFHNETQAHGNGFTSKEMRETEVAKAVRELPYDAQLYAPGFEYVYIYYLTGKPVKPLTDLEKYSDISDNSYVAYLSPCCPNGETPVLPEPYQAGPAKVSQYLYPINKD